MNAIPITNWPSFLLDLNPIKHTVMKMHLKIEFIAEGKEVCCKGTWQSITRSIESTTKRVI